MTKKSSRAMEIEGGKIYSKVYKLFIQLGQVPSSSGNFAYHLMFGRKIRTNLSLLHPCRVSGVALSIVYRSFTVGDQVQVRD